MKYFLLIVFIFSLAPCTSANEKNCYIEDTNCREEKVNCRDEETNCRENCVQERCFDFVEEGKKCICTKKELTDCKDVKTVCDTKRVCDEQLVCEELKGGTNPQ